MEFYLIYVLHSVKNSFEKLNTASIIRVLRGAELDFHYYPCRIQMSLFYQLELIKPGADLNWPSLPLEDVV